MSVSVPFKLTTIGQGQARRFVAHNALNGQNFDLSRSAATLYDDICAVGLDEAVGRAISRGVSEQQVRLDHTALVSAGIVFAPSHLALEPTAKTPPNPLFLRFTFFEVGPFQAYLEPLARIFASLPFFVLGLVTLTSILWLGSTSDWEIYKIEGGLFSLQALTIFAAMSPFMKIFHELGHVLMATANRTRVRKFGVFLIGFFPLPFVDCSDSELLDSRWKRIQVALGGVYADLFVAAAAYSLWAFVEPGGLKVIASQIFMFSALNSLLFNLNPLLRLDGYFIMIDMLGRPNFGGDAQKRTSGFINSLLTVSPKGIVDPVRDVPFMLLYGLASFVYRIIIVSALLWNIAPKFLGIGLAIAVWGALTLFVKPMIDRSLAPPPTLYGHSMKDEVGDNGQSWITLMKIARTLLFLCLFGLVLWLVKWPLAITAPLLVNQEGHYLNRLDESGLILSLKDQDSPDQGEDLYVLSSEDLRLDLNLNALNQAIEEAQIRGLSGLDPLLVEEAERRLSALKDREEDLRLRWSKLRLAPTDQSVLGSFQPVQQIKVGDRAPLGTPYGYTLPLQGDIQTKAEFSAFFGPLFQSHEPLLAVFSAEFPAKRFNQPRLINARVEFDNPNEANEGENRSELDRTLIARTVVNIEYNGRIEDMALTSPTVRVEFGDFALYEHVVLQAQRLWFNFQERRISAQNQT